MKRFCFSILACIFLLSCNTDKTTTLKGENTAITFEYSKIKSEAIYVLTIYSSNIKNELPDIVVDLLTENNESILSHNISYQLNKQSENQIDIHFVIDRNENQLYRSLPIVIQILSQELTLSEKVEVELYDIPQMAELNWPQRTLFKNAKFKEPLKNNKLDIYWLNLGDWELPADPNWDEDPFNNISWQLFYHSLGWLTSLGELYKESQDQKYLDLIDNYLKDYDETFPTSSPDGISYREDAVAVRSNHLLYLYLNFYKDKPADEQTVILSLIDKNNQRLQQDLDNEEYDDDNHGLIQARSGLNIAAVFPLSDNSSAMLESALNRVEETSSRMFAIESGYSVEQAVDYHFVGLSMFLEVKAQLEKLSIEPSEKLMSVLRKAITLSPYLLYDDGTTPALGDSYYNKYWLYYINRYYEVFNEPIEETALFLQYGQDELDDLKIISDEGLIIAKHRSNQGLSKMFFDVSKKRIVHGHFDNLSLIGELAGQKLLVDSGGPYLYSYEGRVNFWGVPAHNTLMINNVVDNKYDAILDHASDEGSYLFGSGTQQISTDTYHKRAFILLKSESPTLVVFDYILNDSNNINSVDEFWHYPEETTFESNGNIRQINLSNGSEFYHYQSAFFDSNCTIVEGSFSESGTPNLGWVSPDYNVANKAPVSQCSANTNDYIKVNVFSISPNLTPTFIKTNGGMQISINNEMYEYNLQNNFVQKN